MNLTDLDHPSKAILTTAEALHFCRKRGLPLSSTALYYNGLKFGFISKAADGYHWEFHRAGLSRYLLQKMDTPPSGYVSVEELARKYKMNLSVVYTKVHAWGVEIARCGRGRKIFVREASFEQKRREKKDRVYLGSR